MGLVFGFAGFTVASAESLVLVDQLLPDWSEGVYSAYYGPSNGHVAVSPGTTQVYLGRSAGIIKAGQGVEPAPSDWDEGLFAFRPIVTIEEFADDDLTYDVVNQYGVNPVWMTIEIEVGDPDTRDDNVAFQMVPAPYGSVAYVTVNAGTATNWLQWTTPSSGITTGDARMLEDIAADPLYAGKTVIRTYLRLGMGTSYYLPTTDDNGTVGFVDKATIGGVTYDFVLVDDEDDDGVVGEADICADTVADNPEELGVNRHTWKGIGDLFTTFVSTGKGNKSEVPSEFSLTETQGCSCNQILDGLEEATGFDFDGHRKFGCSKSVLEDWIANRYYLETVEVPAIDADGVSSLMSLIGGQDYIFKARETANAGDSIDFDADFSFRSISSVVWTDAVSTYEYLTDTLLDLMVDGGFVTWGDNTYHADHVYEYETAGAGSPVTFGVYDVYYPNNTGSLFVDIFAKLY